MAGIIITIGGLPGSGKSTLGKLLAARLGVPFYSMGDIRRTYAREHGWTLEELNRRAESDPESDHLVDRFQARLPEKEHAFIVDSRLGHHFLPQALKLFVKASVRVCATRILGAKRFGEEWTTIDDGVRSLEERIASDKRRYAALYGIDPLDETQYDLVLDSEAHNPLELLEQVLAELHRRGVRLPDAPASKAI